MISKSKPHPQHEADTILDSPPPHTISFLDPDYHTPIKSPSRPPAGIVSCSSYSSSSSSSSLSQSQLTPKCLTRWLLNVLRPSILSHRPPAPLAPTSYLNGLRGFAAFLVYWHHHQIWPRTTSFPQQAYLSSSFGYNDQYAFCALPFIRTFFSGGHFAVGTFFVISGYVLSVKPLSLIHRGEFPRLEESIASAVFRRHARLYLPMLGVVFLWIVFLHATGIWVSYPPRGQTLWHDLVMWTWELRVSTFMFIGGTPEPWFKWNFHLWTLPYEMRGSVIVYTALIAFSRARRNARLWCEVGLCAYFLIGAEGGCHYAFFVAGLIIADLDLLSQSSNLPSIFYTPWVRKYKHAIFYAMFIAGVYLGGVPSRTNDFEELRSNPGWYFLSLLKPSWVCAKVPMWFYLFFAATFLVSSIPHISPLKRFLNHPFCQYLGRISFALYLVHGPVLWTFTDRLYSAVGWPYTEDHELALGAWVGLMKLPMWGPVGAEFAFLAPHLVILPCTVWVAEVVTRVFDENAIKVTHWAYRRILKPVERIVPVELQAVG